MSCFSRVSVFSFITVAGVLCCFPVLAKEAPFRVARAGDPSRMMIVVSDCVKEGDEEASFRVNRLRLNQFIDSLRAWKIRLGEGTNATFARPAIEATSTGACSVDIDDIVPGFVREHHGQHPAHSGPNCWNASLVLSQMVPALRYTTPEEFWFWLDSPLCRLLKNGEAALPGDLVAIRSSEASVGAAFESHGYIYLGNGLAFSKNGLAKENAYELQPEQHVHETYGLKTACSRTDQFNPASCATFANYYRCQSFDEYLRARSTPAPANFKVYKEYLTQAECYVSRHSLEVSVPLKPQFMKTLEDGLSAVEALASEQVNLLKKDANPAARADNFLWRSLLERSRSVTAQLAITNKGSD